MAISMLENLARRCGIVDSYVDARGQRRATRPQTRAALLAAMGFDGKSEEGARRSVEDLMRREWTRVLPPVLVHRTLGPPAVEVALPRRTERIDWCVTLEGGRRISGRARVGDLEVIAKAKVDGVEYLRVKLRLHGDFPHGYHSLSVRRGGERMSLIVAPLKCWIPSEMAAGARFWGITTQLYLLRSQRDWGIGDFGDLRTLADILKPLGAEVIGLNPLHALFPDDPEHASPYSPASRLLLNVLNIDVAQLAVQWESAKARRLIASPAFRRGLSRCRRAGHVRYADVAALKLPVLRMLFDAARSQRRSAAWRAYQRFERAAGEAVKRACLFMALREHFSAQGPEAADWRSWPPAYRHPESAAVKRFVVEHGDLVSFQCWLQYVADDQLRAAAEAASPMVIGLYRDLAVGADPAGAETWSNQRSVVSLAQIGAPDIYNPPGQDWGLPPLNPMALREEGYQGFIDLVRANMRHAGGLRIDHIMGLSQLYWVPRGRTPRDGTYVEYPIDDLVGILALESQRQKCLVVGEDLGTVPAGFRERMAAAHILSYRVLYFERDEQGFLPPERYPELALAVVSSHDLPTLRAWWDVSDLELKAKLKLFPTADDRHTARRERKRDIDQLRQALRREGLIGDRAGADALFSAAHAYLGRTPCMLATVQLDDITDETEPVNVPTTSDERGNWRRRSSLTLEQILKSSRLATVSGIFAAARRNRATVPPAGRHRAARRPHS